ALPCTALLPIAATAATLDTAPTAAMASPTVLTFDAEGRAVDFDVWVDDLQLFLQCDSRDGVSLFDHTSGVSTALATTADSTVCSQWTTRDAVARLAVRSHLLPAERAHFGQYKTAQSLYDAVVACYSSPATAALSRLMMPYLFPNLAAFATVADLVAHLRTSDARYRAALLTEFCAKNPPPPHVAASSQVFAAASRSSPASAPYSCRPLSHENLLCHHRLRHPSLPCLRGMASCALVSGLPRSLPPLPPGPAPTCVPCVEGRQRAAPHSSSFPPTEAPLQTLHMDVKGPAHVRGQGHERYFLLVVDDYSRYTTVFPLRSKGEGIHQTFMLPASPQQNGIAERRIGMYAAHQINLQLRVSLPETTPTLRWTGKVGDATAFRVWGSRAFVRDTTADKLSSRAVPCVFLGFPPDAPGWQFYHPTSRRVLSSQDVTFDEPVSHYRLFPYRTASPPPPPLFLAPSTPPVDPLPPQGPAPSGVSQVDPAEPVEVAVDSGATRSAEPAAWTCGA
ncbi:unnamed protein product, partial [Closterium sp. NIES-53]